MSASNTNLEKQKKRHRGPLTGIAAVLVFVALLLAGYLAWLAYGADNPAAESPAEIVAE